MTPTKGWNPHFDICLEFGEKYENELQKILENKQIELKTDRITQRTGNVFVEFESRGKESGILKTTALYWVFFVYGQINLKNKHTFFIPTRRLKKLIKVKDYKVSKGGDNWTSKGYLVPKQDLLALI